MISGCSCPFASGVHWVALGGIFHEIAGQSLKGIEIADFTELSPFPLRRHPFRMCLTK